MERRTPLLLLILDGWGVREAAPDNAIAAGNTPNWDRLWRECPHSLLQTSGEAVGLPAGQMGNSEVGHMNIGAGRIVYQELTRITRAIEEGEFDATDHIVLHLLVEFVHLQPPRTECSRERLRGERCSLIHTR